MVNYGGMNPITGLPEGAPEKYRDRQFYRHNATVTLMRTTLEENQKLGEEIGRKAAAATGPTAILLPLKGVSSIDRSGQTFDDPTARTALFAAIRSKHAAAELIELDNHINDTAFAEVAAQKLRDLIARRG